MNEDKIMVRSLVILERIQQGPFFMNGETNIRYFINGRFTQVLMWKSKQAFSHVRLQVHASGAVSKQSSSLFKEACLQVT